MGKEGTTVLVFGTFDVIHPGHRWFLQQASEHGDVLVAAVARDSFVAEQKGRFPVKNEQQRLQELRQTHLVDKAILSDKQIHTYKVIGTVQPDVICLGHDQSELCNDLSAWLAQQQKQTGLKAPRLEILPPWKREVYNSTRRNKVFHLGSKDFLIRILAVLGMAAFGFSWVSGKRISGEASPQMLSLIRFTLTALCYLPLFLFPGPSPVASPVRRKGWLWTLGAAAMLSIYNLLFFKGLSLFPAGEGGIMVTTLNPLFTYMFIQILRRGKHHRAPFLGIVLGICGGILLIQPWAIHFNDVLNSGSLIFAGAAVSWSLMTLLSKRAQQYLGFRRFSLGLYIFAAMILGAFVLPSLNAQTFREFSSAFWKDMLFISALAGTFATGIYFLAAHRLGAGPGSSFTYLVPVFALIFTTLKLNEKPQLLTVCGSLLAISAVIIISRGAAGEQTRNHQTR